MAEPRIGFDGRCLQDKSAQRGVGRYALGLLQGFQEIGAPARGVELLLDPRLSDPAELALPDGVVTRQVHLDFLEDPPLLRSLRLNRSLAALELDLYHVPAQFYLFRRLRIRTPSVVSIMDLIPFRLERGTRLGKRLRLQRRLAQLRFACRRARALISISEHTKRDCVELLGLDPEQIRVVPLGVEARYFAAPDAEAVAAVERRSGGRPYFLFVGSQDYQKNFPLLIEAFTRFRSASGSDAQLLVAGRAPAKPGPSKLATGVVPLGFVPEAELPALYAGATALVTLSRYEGFCLPAAEAMAAGTPVLAANSSVFPETVGDAGILVDPDDPAAAAAAMQQLHADARLREELSARGRARAARWNWRQVAERTLAVYAEALGAAG